MTPKYRREKLAWQARERRFQRAEMRRTKQIRRLAKAKGKLSPLAAADYLWHVFCDRVESGGEPVEGTWHCRPYVPMTDFSMRCALEGYCYQALEPLCRSRRGPLLDEMPDGFWAGLVEAVREPAMALFRARKEAGYGQQLSECPGEAHDDAAPSRTGGDAVLQPPAAGAVAAG